MIRKGERETSRDYIYWKNGEKVGGGRFRRERLAKHSANQLQLYYSRGLSSSQFVKIEDVVEGREEE
jgi:hypothetical protein